MPHQVTPHQVTPACNTIILWKNVEESYAPRASEYQYKHGTSTVLLYILVYSRVCAAHIFTRSVHSSYLLVATGNNSCLYQVRQCLRILVASIRYDTWYCMYRTRAYTPYSIVCDCSDFMLSWPLQTHDGRLRMALTL